MAATTGAGAGPGAERIPLVEHVADALALLDAVRVVELIPLDGAAAGRCATSDVRARIDVPGHDNSQMDGFAVAATDLGGAYEDGAGRDGGGQQTTLPLGPTIAAGDAPGHLTPGTARPIMTGAPIPAGADLVVPVEQSAPGSFDRLPSGATTITLHPTDPTPGRFVRRRGSDTRRDDTVLRRDQILTPARIAHLAACGVAEVDVLTRPRTVVLSTGSEVAATVAEMVAGGTPDANGPGLAAALRAAGAEVVHTGTVPDDAAALLETLCTVVEAREAELIITSGGVSEGAFEVVRQAAADPTVTMTFDKVAMQPGGPQGLGTLDLPPVRDVGARDAGQPGRRVPWLAFPGNPVSALLSCELIARPALRAPERMRLRLPLALEQAEPSPPALAQYRRARVLPSGRVRLAGGPSSHLIGGLAAANALVIVPVGVASIHDGDLLETILLPEGDS